MILAKLMATLAASIAPAKTRRTAIRARAPRRSVVRIDQPIRTCFPGAAQHHSASRAPANALMVVHRSRETESLILRRRCPHHFEHAVNRRLVLGCFIADRGE